MGMARASGQAPEPAPVEIAEYDPSWPLRFAAEQARLRAALAGQAVSIEHVGSTAVPGLAARPEIDVAVAFADLAGAASAVPRLLQLGYQRDPSSDREGGFCLCRRDGSHAYRIWLTTREGEFWRRQLRFRDRLRADPRLAREYARARRNLAAEPGSYAAGKAAFTASVMGDVDG
jgi:GrpB-like predicted nucleotidyltransferase (UPF0157 family)